MLTPLAVDPGHPFPYISDLSLSLAVTVRDPETGERRFARIKVPPVLPRLWEVGVRTYALLEQIIAANLDILFPGMEVLEHHLFRVTRNADLAIEEDEADDLLMAIEEELRKRRFGKVVRLEVERSMPHDTRALLQRGLGLEPQDVYEISGMLDLSALGTIADLDIPQLQPQPWQPVVPLRLLPPDEDEEADVFAAIREADILLHHPYESFAGSVQRFIEQATEDPDVLTIKMTLYRTSGDSPIVRSLIAAAEAGKQVVVMVEIKARFDERANIVWARALERAGAHVAYGLVGLKTHCKAALVVRREGRGLRRYVHIGTGNYNPSTARLYVDLGLLSDDNELASDVTDLFNVLTGRRAQEPVPAPAGRSGGPARPHPRADRRGDRAPAGARRRPHHHQEQRHRRSHGHRRALPRQPGGRPDRSHRAGHVRVRPGVPGVSETIRVRSIVGRFLEHSRIFSFGQGDRERFFIGSADMMERNLDRRIEAITPVTEPALDGAPAPDPGGDAGRRPARVGARRRRRVAPRGDAGPGAAGRRHVRDVDGRGTRLARARRVTVEARAPQADPQEVELKYAVRDAAALRERLDARAARRGHGRTLDATQRRGHLFRHGRPAPWARRVTAPDSGGAGLASRWRSRPGVNGGQRRRAGRRRRSSRMRSTGAWSSRDRPPGHSIPGRGRRVLRAGAAHGHRRGGAAADPFRRPAAAMRAGSP